MSYDNCMKFNAYFSLLANINENNKFNENNNFIICGMINT